MARRTPSLFPKSRKSSLEKELTKLLLPTPRRRRTPTLKSEINRMLRPYRPRKPALLRRPRVVTPATALRRFVRELLRYFLSPRVVMLAFALLATLAYSGALNAAELPRLKVSDSGRYLVTEDGKPFFWLGDTAWELFHRLNKEETIAYLDNRQKLGYTVVQAVVVAELDGKDAPSADGFLPFGPDPKEPSPVEVEGEYNDYWDRVDFVVAEANKRGIYVAALPTWGRYWRDEAFFNAGNAAKYGEWLGKRYKDAGVVWVLGGDRPIENDEQRATLDEMARGLKLGDEGAHLITFHPCGGRSSTEFCGDSQWIDFHMRQNGHNIDYNSYRGTFEDYCRDDVKPVLDGEPVYEEHPVSFNPDNLGHTAAFDVRKPLYWDLFNGAFGHTYGCHAIWQMFDPAIEAKYPVNRPLRSWRDSLDLPGAAQMQYGRYLIESRPFLTRIPDMDLIVPDGVESSVPGRGTRRFAATRDEEGTYAFVYFPISRAATIDVSRIKGETLVAYWYDPRTGAVELIDTFKNEGRREFTPPTLGEDMDWVLVIDDASKNYPKPGKVAKKPRKDNPVLKTKPTKKARD